MARVYINSLNKFLDEIPPEKLPEKFKHLLNDSATEKHAKHVLPNIGREDADGEQFGVDSVGEPSDKEDGGVPAAKPKPRRKKRQPNRKGGDSK